MKNILVCAALILICLITVDSNIYPASQKRSKVVNYVNPIIGTGGHGHVYPGATVPYGMIQLSPDNGTNGWDWCSGYNYSDSIIAGFTHTHLSGTGCGDLCDILLMPTVNKVTLDDNIILNEKYNFSSRFSHMDEKAEPGYYSVLLKDYNITTELTAAQRSGMHKYTFPENKNSAVILDLGYHINWDTPVETKIQVENNSTVTGYRFSKGWAKNQKIFFAIKFSKPFEKFAIGDGLKLNLSAKEAQGKSAKGIFSYATKTNEQIMLKIGISYVSIEGAKKNLAKEIPGWNFEKIRSNASNQWEKELSRINVETKDESQKKIFYTSLYHTKLAPVIFSDVDGQYRGADDKIHQSKDFQDYTIFSLWDTFRALHPLMTITDKERISDMVNSMLAYFREYGLLPNWPLMANETNIMIGIHSVPVIVDAYFKGVKGFNAVEAYNAMKVTAMQDSFGLKLFRDYNYIPADKEIESVSKTLEYAFDHWCIAQMAKSLGREDDYKVFMKRALSYKNLFDSTTCFMRGKLSDGSWKTPFDPLAVDHRNNEYTEGNGWQYLWFVPHNVNDLIGLMGGNDKFADKLDSLFSLTEKIKGENVSPDISGLIGQYAHGNEPCHHVAYLYNYAGKPWKTQERIRNIINTMYKAEPEGLPGNEDCGQMSAWYVLSSIGFYPVNPASGKYDIGSPVFDKVSISVDNGKKFHIIAKDNSKDNVYIQSALLNGRKLNNPFISHKEIMKGGTLIFQMGSKPNEKWGTMNIHGTLLTTNDL